MIDLGEIKEIAHPSPAKIVMLVIDGLGGLPHPETGKTELETANTPNLDSLAGRGACGLTDPVSPGITPGSGPGHLALFGYNPLQFTVGRGVLEALGIDFDLRQGDIAARGNFCTVDHQGLVIDRRAGRITTEKCSELCQLLSEIELVEDSTGRAEVQLFVSPVREHRFVAIFRREGLSAGLSDSDPQQTGAAPKTVAALAPQSQKTANIVNAFIEKAANMLKGHQPANMILLRGFSQYPEFPSLGEIYKLNPAAIAAYPMYRGLAKLVGMKVLDSESSIRDEFLSLRQHYKRHDFFFIHIKQTDSAGEDGDFKRKVSVLEEVDSNLHLLTDLEPDVIIVAGDHSTPATLKGHSWHSVPLLLYSRWCRSSQARCFSEPACALGELGRFPATQVMPLAMAHALKLSKFGA